MRIEWDKEIKNRSKDSLISDVRIALERDGFVFVDSKGGTIMLVGNNKDHLRIVEDEPLVVLDEVELCGREVH